MKNISKESSYSIKKKAVKLLSENKLVSLKKQKLYMVLLAIQVQLNQ